MRIVNLKNEQGSFKILTENKIIDISFDLNHPELILEDNSMIIFDKVETYYKFIGNADLYSMQDNSINLESLLSDYLIAADTVSEVSYKGDDISVVYELVYDDHHICYIQRTGINPLAV
jgi:hypothetical protein